MTDIPRFRCPACATNIERIQKLERKLETLQFEHDDLVKEETLAASANPLAGLSKQQSSILIYLAHRGSAPRSRLHILMSETGRTYMDPEDVDMKRIDVRVSQIRWWIKANGYPIRIQTVCGWGYRMNKESRDFVIELSQKLSQSGDIPAIEKAGLSIDAMGRHVGYGTLRRLLDRAHKSAASGQPSLPFDVPVGDTKGH